MALATAPVTTTALCGGRRIFLDLHPLEMRPLDSVAKAHWQSTRGSLGTRDESSGTEALIVQRSSISDHIVSPERVDKVAKEVKERLALLELASSLNRDDILDERLRSRCSSRRSSNVRTRAAFFR